MDCGSGWVKVISWSAGTGRRATPAAEEEGERESPVLIAESKGGPCHRYNVCCNRPLNAISRHVLLQRNCVTATFFFFFTPFLHLI